MFENFPKKRSELTSEYQKIYEQHYKDNRTGGTTASSCVNRLEKWMHHKVCADLSKNTQATTLEIGAGTLNHLDYETIYKYDIIEPFENLYLNSKFLNQIRSIYKDISEIDSTTKYDRIISIATFEHILNLPQVVAKSCTLLNENGTLRVAIPNEGSFCWKMGWKLSTSIEFNLKYHLDYEVIMKHEHVNTANEIDKVLNYFFKTVKCSSFGLNKTLAFYRFYECKQPEIEKALSYLKTNNS